MSAYCKRWIDTFSGLFYKGFCLFILIGCKGETAKSPNLQDQHNSQASQVEEVQTIYDKALAWAEKGDPRILILCDSLLDAPDKKAGASPYYYLGIYYAEIKDTVKSLTFFDKTIVADYTFLEAYIEKAALLLAQKKPETARKELELLRAVAPSYAPCHYWIAKVATYEQKNELALFHYKLALSLDSTLQEASDAIRLLEK